MADQTLNERIEQKKYEVLAKLENALKPVKEIVLKAVFYPHDLLKLIYFLKTKNNYCDKIESNNGCYCKRSKHFIGNKEFVKYFCTDGGKPNIYKKREKNILNSYIGCCK